MLFLLVILIFIWVLWHNNDVNKKSEEDKNKDTWAYLSQTEKAIIDQKNLWWSIFTLFFPLISCIYFKRWTLLVVCIIEFCLMDFTIHLAFGVNYPIVYCIVIRIMVLYNFIWVNYNAWYFRNLDNKNWSKKNKKWEEEEKIVETVEKHTNKIKSKKSNKIVMIILCCFISIIISWCGINWSIQWNQKSLKCYTESWTLNKHPLKDAEWNMVNCYNNIWEQDWKWLYYNDSWQISGIENFKNWELNGKRIDYYDNWQIEEEWFYISWFNYNWERIRYYYDWKIRYVWYYKNWKEDWKWVSYYKNWKINYVWYYKNWEQDWERVSYNEDWEIDWKIIFSGWIIVNNDIENTDIIHFGVDNFFEENLTKRMLCYTSYGYPNFVPERNEDWDIINCYDRSWNMNGKWVMDIDTSVIDGVESIWKVKMEGDFLNWKENWKMKYYYENWNIQLEIMYINWIEEWLRKSYYENGQTKSKWNNKNWEKSWKETTYYQNGQVESEIMFKNWKQDWESKLYNESWQTMLVWNFKNWVKDGNRIYYYDNWIVKFEENYKNWKLNGDVVLYKENWEVDTKAFYKNWNRIK